MVATARPAPSSPAGPSAQGRSAVRIASDARGAIEVLRGIDVSRRLERRCPEHRIATSCIGRPRSQRRGSHPGRRRFSGQTRSGRYSWARYYHPGLQRFISEDPIGFDGRDVNLYAYARNTPTHFTDPTGEVVEVGVLAYLGICTAGGLVVEAIDIKLFGRKPDPRAALANVVTVCSLGLVKVGGKVPSTPETPGLPFRDPARISRIEDALGKAQAGVRRFEKDLTVFRNREGRLPSRPEGYYTEYTVPRPDGTRGVERLVLGKGGEVYYSPNHYQGFIRIE
jgi:RHS repeat-associated protein